MKRPTIKKCKEYMEHCGYKFDHKIGRCTYVFVDETGKRPLHMKSLMWTLTEIRDATINGF